MKLEQLLQKSEKLERSLIGLLLSRPKDIPIAKEFVSESDFYHHGNVFKHIENGFIFLKENNIKTSQYLDVNLIGVNVKSLSLKVRDISNAIKLHRFLQKSLEEIPSDDLEKYTAEFQRELMQEIQENNPERMDIDSLIKQYEDRQKFYIDKFKNGGGIIGIPCGFPKLDKVIDGLRPEHLWVLGGYTNTGKTAGALNIVKSLVENKKRAVYYSLEMTEVDILSRLLGILTNQSGLEILKGFPHNEESVGIAKKKIRESQLSIISNKSDISEIAFSMLAENIKNKVDVFFVDFLQLVTLKNARSEYETMTNVILELQQLAKKLNSTIVVLSQLSNEGAKDNTGNVMGFKGSGSIAAAADLAIEIKSAEDSRDEWKRKIKNGEPISMEWDIRKNRHGMNGTVDMIFEGRTGLFCEISEEQKKEMHDEQIKF